MSNQIKHFIFCVHAHQPIGNFDNVFEEAYEKSYKPFFEVMDRHPQVLVVAHFSGCLLDWIEQKRPEFIRFLRAMGERGQIEFLGGACYEPVYGVIPRHDLEGQIEMMRERIKALFGKAPEGAWLTERVWDMTLIKTLDQSKVKYTILDDLHFEKTGMSSPVCGYYQAADGKHKVDLFASMKQLRYLMPFRKPEEAVDFLVNTDAGSDDVFVTGDDIEKFGMWPGTYRWVYEERWLDLFLCQLEKRSNIKPCTFGQFRQMAKPKQTVKIPHASYSEMMEWSGGNFYNFFKKYSESEYMRDRMWSVSQEVEKVASAKGMTSALEEAKKTLYKSQCNCSYWHGVFGGLYLHHLRSAVFENLIRTRALLKKTEKKLSAFEDGRVEVEKLESGDRWRLDQKDITTYFNPGYGLAMEELDYLPKTVNLMCNLKRQKEIYHETVLKKISKADNHEPLSIHEILGTKEKDLDKLICYDPCRRLSFMDHIFAGEISHEQFSRCTYTEAGDFIGSEFKPLPSASKKTEGYFTFERRGKVTLHGKSYPLTLQKAVYARGGSALKVLYEFKNLSDKEICFTFGVEFNFSIGDTNAMKGLSEKNIKEWIFNDTWRNIWIKLIAKEEGSLLAFPVETVSESESGLERTYQELGVLWQKPVQLKGKQSKEYALELQVS